MRGSSTCARTGRGNRLARRIFGLSVQRNERLLSRLEPGARDSLEASMHALIEEAQAMLGEASAGAKGRRQPAARGQ